MKRPALIHNHSLGVANLFACLCKHGDISEAPEWVRLYVSVHRVCLNTLRLESSHTHMHILADPRARTKHSLSANQF